MAIRKELTKAEEQVMHHLWDLENAFVKDVLEAMDDPKPAYNTVSTIIRILENKGFVGHKAFGKTHQYFPRISKKDYRKFSLSNLLERYFDGSPAALVSHFVKDKKIDATELDEILKTIDQSKKQ